MILSWIQFIYFCNISTFYCTFRTRILTVRKIPNESKKTSNIISNQAIRQTQTNVFKIILKKQESPPAWTQEAYRPPRSKCSLCWGVPCPRSGGTLSQVWGGTPSQVWEVPHPRSRGVPHARSGGYPIPGWGVPCPRSGGTLPLYQVWGYPIPGLGGGGTLSQVWGEYLPLARPEMGYPPSQTWDGVPSPARPGMGYPTGQTWDGVFPGQTLDRVPPSQTWDGVPPPLDLTGVTPPPPEMWTEKQTENSTSPHPSDAGGKKHSTFLSRKSRMIEATEMNKQD